MRRREFIASLGGATVWPLVAQAQQTKPLIGFLASQTPDLFANHLRAFRQGLSEAGYVEDRNVKVEYRWAQGQYNRLSMLAADLVNQHVDVIAAIGPPAALAAKAATSTIPFVFTSGGDVVKSGLVVSLNRPGGNATGVNLFTQAVEAKKLELLAKLVPTSTAFAFLINPHNPAAEGKMKEMQDAARGLSRELHVLNASNESEVDTAFASMAQLRVSALIVGSDPFFDDSLRVQLITLAARHSIPAIYGQREYAADGGLMSYGTSLADVFRQVGVYTGRILKGEKPADLPVVQPTKFEFVFNLKTVKTLDLTIPPTVLALADEVIE
jgi:putative ABC transport system substrate-binding protein